VHSACQNVRPARGGAPLTARESASGSRRKALGISNKVPLRRHRHELRPTHVKLPPVLHSTIIAYSLVPALIFPSLPFPLSNRIRRQKLIHMFCCSPSFSVYKARTYYASDAHPSFPLQPQQIISWPSHHNASIPTHTSHTRNP
jgi:hypothetical protein